MEGITTEHEYQEVEITRVPLLSIYLPKIKLEIQTASCMSMFKTAQQPKGKSPSVHHKGQNVVYSYHGTLFRP